MEKLVGYKNTTVTTTTTEGGVGMPPGLAKQGKMPPGLAKKGKIPPGWSKGESSTTIVETEKKPGLIHAWINGLFAKATPNKS